VAACFRQASSISSHRPFVIVFVSPTSGVGSASAAARGARTTPPLAGASTGLSGTAVRAQPIKSKAAT
jgi:hypothetical protein